MPRGQQREPDQDHRGQAVQAAAQVFGQLGAQVIPVEFPDGYAAAAANVGMVTSDAAAFHLERIQTRPDDFGADVLERMRGGAARTSAEYVRLRREQEHAPPPGEPEPEAGEGGVEAHSPDPDRDPVPDPPSVTRKYKRPPASSTIPV